MSRFAGLSLQMLRSVAALQVKMITDPQRIGGGGGAETGGRVMRVSSLLDMFGCAITHQRRPG